MTALEGRLKARLWRRAEGVAPGRRAGGADARLRADFIACDGRGLCAEALPELITLDDWGFPIVSDRPVPSQLLPDARETIRACPMLALRLEHGGQGKAVMADTE
jgi:ferredoxin